MQLRTTDRHMWLQEILAAPMQGQRACRGKMACMLGARLKGGLAGAPWRRPAGLQKPSRRFCARPRRRGW